MCSWHGGKGDKYRKVDTKKYQENYDLIFRKKTKVESEQVNEEKINGGNRSTDNTTGKSNM